MFEALRMCKANNVTRAAGLIPGWGTCRNQPVSAWPGGTTG